MSACTKSAGKCASRFCPSCGTACSAIRIHACATGPMVRSKASSCGWTLKTHKRSTQTNPTPSNRPFQARPAQAATLMRMCPAFVGLTLSVSGFALSKCGRVRRASSSTAHLPRLAFLSAWSHHTLMKMASQMTGLCSVRALSTATETALVWFVAGSVCKTRSTSAGPKRCT